LTICPSCGSNKQVISLLQKFKERDLGHSYCKACKISFDSNASEMMQYKLDSTKIDSVYSEEEYRSLFIATPALAKDGGPIYAKTGFVDEASLKSGIAAPVIEEIRKQHKGGEHFRLLDLECGNGFTCLEIRQAFPQAFIIGIDPSTLVKNLNDIPISSESRIRSRR